MRLHLQKLQKWQLRYELRTALRHQQREQQHQDQPQPMARHDARAVLQGQVDGSTVQPLTRDIPEFQEYAVLP